MKPKVFLPAPLVVAFLVLLQLNVVNAASLTNDTLIGSGDLTYEGQDLVVDGCIATINGPHTFSSLAVVNGGVVTHSPYGSNPDNALNLTVTGDVTVGTTGSISANSKGYGQEGGPGAGGPSGYNGCGGGHGGRGGGSAGGVAYGSVTEPVDMGSGGGHAFGGGGGAAGGGVIRLTIGGTLTVDGSMAANGGNGGWSQGQWYGGTGGGGSGGSIWVTATVLSGEGIISANGGTGGAGGGGGGRIAIYYDTDAFTGTMSAYGIGGGGAGSIFTKSSADTYGRLVIENGGQPGSTPLVDGTYQFDFLDITSGFDVTSNVVVTADLINVQNGGYMTIGGDADVSCREICLSPDGTLVLNKALSVETLQIRSSGMLTHSPGQNGFALTVTGDLMVEAGGTISADRKGYGGSTGPGAGTFGGSYGGKGSGAGYGGHGGNAGSRVGGGTYGSEIEPTDLGSGGGHSSYGGRGGGKIRLSVLGTLTVDGTISADGGNGGSVPSQWYTGLAGGGSGGSIWINADTLVGSGEVSAKGGTGAGGGGGGRIAIYTNMDAFAGITDVDSLGNGEPGTIHMASMNQPPTAPVLLSPATNPLPVAFIPQVPPGEWANTNNCGQACALMAMSYHNGTEPTEQGIKDIDDWLFQKYDDPINDYNGSVTDTVKLEALVKEFGGFGKSYRDHDWSLTDLKTEIDNGLPVIAAVTASYLSNRGYNYSGGHFVLAVGYTETHIVCNDPGTNSGWAKHYLNSEFSEALSSQNGSVVVVVPDEDVRVNPYSVILRWNPSTDPDGDAIEYCVTLNEESEPDDIPVFMGCDNEILTSETSFAVPFVLEPGKKYWWAVWARDEHGQWSEASAWWMFTTGKIFDFQELNVLPSYYWNDFSDRKESIYAIIRNLLDYPDYTYDGQWDDFFRTYAQSRNRPVSWMYVWDDGTIEMGEIITPWFDARWDWDDSISSDSHFNKVYAVSKDDLANNKFEVISFVDEDAPFCGTENHNSYFFSYDTRMDNQGVAVTLNRWIAYLRDVKDYYEHTIDVLTIFAHGTPGDIRMSDLFHLRNDDQTRQGMEQLKWNPGENDGILSEDATILLFSCHVGQDSEGKEFVRSLANWTGATVYANTELTGELKRNGNGLVTRDWELDVIGVPDDFIMDDEYRVFIQSNIKTTLLIPGGVSVEIDKDTLTQDGNLVITNVTDQLQDMGIDPGGNIVFGAYDFRFEEGMSIAPEKYIELTIPFDSSLATWQIDITNTAVRYWNQELQQWSEEGIQDVEFHEDYVTFKTNHATVFASLSTNQPPSSNAGPDQTVPVGPDCTATVALDGSGSSDPDQDSLTYVWTWNGGSAIGVNPTIELPLGAHTLTLVVNDGMFDSEQNTVTITAIDTTSPEITLSVSPDTLWPPNHKMVHITPTMTATDNCVPDPVVELTSITMNEGEETNTYDPSYDTSVGDGHTIDDIQVEDGNIYLRAERSGTGSGRVYTIIYTATDASGNSATANATVTVPHNQ